MQAFFALANFFSPDNMLVLHPCHHIVELEWVVGDLDDVVLLTETADFEFRAREFGSAFEVDGLTSSSSPDTNVADDAVVAAKSR